MDRHPQASQEAAMPALSTVALFLAAALVLLLIPGPAVLNIVTCSATRGRRAGLICVVGTEAAGLIHTTAAALGLSALLMSSAAAFSAVKYLGAAYLVFLGARTLLARAESPGTPALAPRSVSQLFTQGFLVNLLNPKTALFFFAFLPQFVDPTRGAAGGQIFLFGAIFVTLAFCTDGAYALLAGTAGRWFKGNDGLRTSRRYLAGGMYIGLGLTAAFAGSERK
jgi:threonine/homoserine/homoserine lactone efflux protein